MKINIQKNAASTNLDEYLVKEHNKLGQSVNPTSDVVFHNMEINGNLNVVEDIRSSGLIIGNIVNTSSSGISISQPSLTTIPVSNIDTITGIVSELIVYSATYATLNATFTVLTNTASTSDFLIFYLFLPGVIRFTNSNLYNYTFVANAFNSNLNVVDSIISVGIVDQRYIEIKAPLSTIIDTLTFQIQVGYTFIASPNVTNFVFTNPSSNININNITPIYSTLLTTIDNNQIQLSFTIDCSSFNTIESFQIQLPNKTTNFTTTNELVGIIQGTDLNSNHIIDTATISSFPGSKNALVSWLTTNVIMEFNCFIVYNQN
jgi:hypothetical protein